jgi:uncharacterized membrane protein YeaQ/YmgE (transglycosylase-associated protein family)
MSLESLLILLLLAGICWAVGQAISGSWTGGILGSIVIGFIGWLVGSWLAMRLVLGELLPLDIGGWSFPIAWSIIGATPFVALIGLFVDEDTADTSNHNNKRPPRN